MAHLHPPTLDCQVDPMPIEDLLAFIDECDVGSSESEEDGKGHGSRPIQSAGHPGATKPKRVRRQRHELLELRDKVQELEFKLAFVRHGMDVAAAVLCDPDDELCAPFEKSMSVWGRVAERQCRLRALAERENAHLKAMLEAQVKLADNLATVLKRTSHSDILQELNPSSSDASRSFPGGNTDPQSIHAHDQAKSLQRIYEDTDAAFAAAGMSVSPFQVYDMQIKQNSDQSFAIEFLSHHVLAVDAATTSDALWHPMTSGLLSQYRQVSTQAQDTVARNLGFMAKTERFQAQFCGTRCMRRYTSAERTVFVWDSLIEPEGVVDGLGPDHGFRLHRRVRMAVQDADAAAPCSSVKVLIQLSPESSSDVHADLVVAQQHGGVSALVEFLFTVAEELADITTRMLRETLDDTVHVKVVEKHRLSKTDTTITARMVVKWFEESERSVILWEQCLDVEGVLPMRVWGSGFHVLRAPLASSTDASVSVFQSLSQVSPDPAGGQYAGNSRAQDSAVWDLTKLALSSYYCNMDLLDQVIQAVLLSESTTTETQAAPN